MTFFHNAFITTFKLFIIFSLFLRCTICETSQESVQQEFLICRHCGSDIADLHYLYDHYSPEALLHTNQSLFGRSDVSVQILENPLGIRFQVVTLAKAACADVDKWHTEHSWFPGFAWKHCLCPRCGAHIGWIFEPIATATFERKTASDEGFYALILDSVFSESYVNSLLIIPSDHQT